MGCSPRIGIASCFPRVQWRSGFPQPEWGEAPNVEIRLRQATGGANSGHLLFHPGGWASHPGSHPFWHAPQQRGPLNLRRPVTPVSAGGDRFARPIARFAPPFRVCQLTANNPRRAPLSRRFGIHTADGRHSRAERLVVGTPIFLHRRVAYAEIDERRPRPPKYTGFPWPPRGGNEVEMEHARVRLVNLVGDIDRFNPLLLMLKSKKQEK